MMGEDESVTHIALRVADALEEQVGLHIALARAELTRDAHALAKDVAPFAVGVPLLGVAYLFACAAGALLLMRWVGPAGGFGIVGGLNLVLGGVAVAWSLVRLRKRRAPEITVGPELARSAGSIASTLRNGPAQVEVSHGR